MLCAADECGLSALGGRKMPAGTPALLEPNRGAELLLWKKKGADPKESAPAFHVNFGSFVRLKRKARAELSNESTRNECAVGVDKASALEESSSAGGIVKVASGVRLVGQVESLEHE